MPAYALTATAMGFGTEPYVTPQEFKQAATRVDWANLVPGDPESSEAELFNNLMRASSWADNVCNQPLGATIDSGQEVVTVGRDGKVRIHPRQTPCTMLTSFQYGADPSSMTALTDFTGVWVEPDTLTVPLASSGLVSSSGALGFGTGAAGAGDPVYVQYDYASGWPNTTLTAAANAGDTTLQVNIPVGILPAFTLLGIYDGPFTEMVGVSASYVPGASVVALQTPLQYAHAQYGPAGVSVSALPPIIKQSVISLTAALCRNGGSQALVMASLNAAPKTKTLQENGWRQDVVDALTNLASFGRVR